MTKTRRPRARITNQLKQEMLKLSRGGLPHVEISRRLNVHRQTVSKYVEEALAESGESEIRRAALAGALTAHWQALSAEAQALAAEFVIPNPYSAESLDVRVFEAAELSRERRLLLSGLREHAPREAIWAAIDEWNAQVVSVNQRLRDLRNKLGEVIQKLRRGLDFEPEEPLEPTLFRNAVALASHGMPALDSAFVNSRQAGGQWELQLRETQRLGRAPTEEAIEQAKETLLALAQESSAVRPDAWSESSALKEDLQKLNQAHDNILDAVAIFILRGAYSGTCKLCPF